MEYQLNSYADLKEVIENSSYAEKKYLLVKPYESELLEQLKHELKCVDSGDNLWKEKVSKLKVSISREKQRTKLFIIKYNKQYLNIDNLKTLGMFRSVVTDGCNIYSFAPPKSSPIDMLKEEVDIDNCLNFVEGTMINVFKLSIFKYCLLYFIINNLVRCFSRLIDTFNFETFSFHKLSPESTHFNSCFNCSSNSLS